MSEPSAWQLETAMSTLMSVRQQLIDLDPDIVDDETLLRDTLEGQTGDAFEVLDAAIRAAIVAEGMADEANARAKGLAARADRYKARAENLRAAAFAALNVLEIPRYVRADFTASIRKGRASVVITDESALPAWFIRTKTEPDKSLIATALRNGQEVSGAEMTAGPPTLMLKTT